MLFYQEHDWGLLSCVFALSMGFLPLYKLQLISQESWELSSLGIEFPGAGCEWQGSACIRKATRKQQNAGRSSHEHGPER